MHGDSDVAAAALVVAGPKRWRSVESEHGRQADISACNNVDPSTLPGYRRSRGTRIAPVIAKVLASIIIALGAAAGLAPPADADPSAFNVLSCDCQSPPDVGPAAPDQIARGIRDGLADRPRALRPTPILAGRDQDVQAVAAVQQICVSADAAGYGH